MLNRSEFDSYTEAEMAEMTFEFLIRLNCEVEEIYAHAMGVKLRQVHPFHVATVLLPASTERQVKSAPADLPPVNSDR